MSPHQLIGVHRRVPARVAAACAVALAGAVLASGPGHGHAGPQALAGASVGSAGPAGETVRETAGGAVREQASGGAATTATGTTTTSSTTSFSSSSFGPTPSPLNPCGPVWTVPDNDVEGILYVQIEPEPTAPVGLPLPPQLDLTQGTMSLDKSTLVVRLYVEDMEKQVLPGTNAIGWQMNWSIGSTAYFANATYDSTTGATTAVAGSLSGPAAAVDVPASLVTGPGGYVEIDVPLADTGNPPSGTLLTGIVGHSLFDASRGSGLDADNGGPIYDFEIGQTCKK